LKEVAKDSIKAGLTKVSAVMGTVTGLFGFYIAGPIGGLLGATGGVVASESVKKVIVNKTDSNIDSIGTKQ
jgi:hypothetical protein